MKQISTSTFMGLIDDIVLCSKSDPLLKEGIEIIDESAKEEGKSFYQMMYEYLCSDPSWKLRLKQ